MKTDTLNEAIDKIAKIKGMDLQSYHSCRPEIWNILVDVYDAASRESRILSAVPSEEIEYYVTERELFIKIILEQEWDQQMRTAAESMIIAYDQMLDKLKRAIAR